MLPLQQAANQASQPTEHVQSTCKSPLARNRGSTSRSGTLRKTWRCARLPRMVGWRPERLVLRGTVLWYITKGKRKGNHHLCGFPRNETPPCQFSPHAALAASRGPRTSSDVLDLCLATCPTLPNLCAVSVRSGRLASSVPQAPGRRQGHWPFEPPAFPGSWACPKIRGTQNPKLLGKGPQ